MAIGPLCDYLYGMIKMRPLLVGAICAVLLPISAMAAKPKTKPPVAPAVDPGPAKPLGSAGSWTAYLAQNKAGKVCYLVGQPEKSEPTAMKRNPVMAMITHRTED